MRPYSKIKIDDIYTSDVTFSTIFYKVTDKCDGLIELNRIFRHKLG